MPFGAALGRLKDYMLAPPRDPSAVIGEDNEPMPDLVPDASSPTGYREAYAPRSSSLPKTRIADFAGRLGAVGGIIPTHGASGAQQFFTGLMGGMSANQNRDLMLAQQARADRQQWLGQQQQISNAANLYKRNQIADAREAAQEERNKEEAEQRRKTYELSLYDRSSLIDKRRADEARLRAQEQAAEKDKQAKQDWFNYQHSRPLTPQESQDFDFDLITGATPGGNVMTAFDQPRMRNTNEEQAKLDAAAYGVKHPAKPKVYERRDGVWRDVVDQNTGQLTGRVEKIEGLPGKDAREWAARWGYVYDDSGTATAVNLTRPGVAKVPGAENIGKTKTQPRNKSNWGNRNRGQGGDGSATVNVKGKGAVPFPSAEAAAKFRKEHPELVQ